MKHGACWTLLLAMISGCSRRPPPLQADTRGAATVARVGEESIDLATVQRIESSQQLSPSAALDVAVTDALLAAAAGERSGVAAVRQARRSALARLLLEELQREAEARGSPTDEEVAAATERRWWELDRPPLLKTTHAVVVVKGTGEDKAAHALANRIAAAVSGISDPSAFKTAAKAVPKGDFDVHVEDLEPVARDGRVVNPDAPPPPGSTVGQYAPSFVEAAYAIPAIGKQSPVVRTEFGYHVILAVRAIPERRVPLEERRAKLAEEIVERRTVQERDALLARARDRDRVDVERSALEYTERVKASP